MLESAGPDNSQEAGPLSAGVLLDEFNIRHANWKRGQPSPRFCVPQTQVTQASDGGATPPAKIDEVSQQWSDRFDEQLALPQVVCAATPEEQWLLSDACAGAECAHSRGSRGPLSVPETQLS